MPIMLLPNTVSRRDISEYSLFIDENEIQKLQSLALKFQNLRVIHVNATPHGGGVAEILQSLVPLQQNLGLSSFWFSLAPDEELFRITKKLHNSLQGAKISLSDPEKEYYRDFNRRLANEILQLHPDILVIHDPQPLGVIDFIPTKSVFSIVRIHIDLTCPDPDSLGFIQHYLHRCSRLILSHEDFIPKQLRDFGIRISPPAIDPISEKNRIIPREERHRALKSVFIDPSKPLLTHVSRFDPWKDQFGTLEIYRKVKKSFPDVQLVFCGIVEAQDDPEAVKILKILKKEIGDDPDVFLFFDQSQLAGMSSNHFVNVLESSADVFIHKSLREGFGLAVTEAMWKKRPVIAGNVGGLRLQIQDSVNGYLVNDVDTAVERAIFLLEHPDVAQKIGQEARESVWENFLITRLLRDEFEIMKPETLGLKHT